MYRMSSFDTCTDFGPAHERTERTRSESASPASAGGTREGRKMDVEPGFRSVTDEPHADRPIPRPTVARATGGCSPRRAGFGRYYKGSSGRRLMPAAGAGPGTRRRLRSPPGDLRGKGGKAEPAAAGGSAAPFGVPPAQRDDGRGREPAVRGPRGRWRFGTTDRAEVASATRAGEGAPRAVAPGPTGSAAREGELRLVGA